MSFMIEEFKKTFQENHQPLFKNIKKQIRNSSRDPSNENKQNLHNDTIPTLNTNLLNKNAASKQNQQKFFVYVNSPNSPNSCPLKEELQQCQKENNLKQSQRFQQRGFQKQANTLYTDENTQQSQLEETLSLSMSDLNTIQPNNITLNSFRNSINSQIQFQILQKNQPQKKVGHQQIQNAMPLQNNQLYLNQQEPQDQDKKRTNSYLNTYNIKKSQNNNTQMNIKSNKNFSNPSDVQNQDDKITQNQMIQKKYQINYDTQESLDPRNTQKQMQNGNKNFNCQQTDYQERVSSNSSINNLDKIKGLQNNNKGYSVALNSVQSMLQSNQHYSTQSIADGNFSIASYGLNQYYLLNMHHIVRIQRFFKSKCISNQQRLSYTQNIQRQIRKNNYQQQEKFNQNNINNSKQQAQMCERRNSVQNNNGSTFINSYQQQQDNMSNMNNVSNSFNFEVVSFGQKDNLYQLPSDKNNNQNMDLGYQRSSYQNQTFEEVEEVEEEVDEVGDDDDENIQTPFHHYPGITYIQSSGGFEQQINSLQRLQSVDIDNIQGRFDQEEDVNQNCINQQYNSDEIQKQKNQQTKLNKQESFSNYQNQKITQNSPKFPVNVDSQYLNSISEQQNENKVKTKLEINDKENIYQIQQFQQNYKPESQQSTTSASSSHYSIESLKQENTKLKKMMYQMKLDMKSQLEEGLVQQKNQMKTINDEYLQFIEKIMTDKKELTKKCDNLIQENQQLLQQIENVNFQLKFSFFRICFNLNNKIKKKELNQSEKKKFQDINEQFLTAELDSKQDESNQNDQLLEKLKKTQIENDKLYDSFMKQQEFILKLQNENEELVQKLQKSNLQQNYQQNSNNDDQCKDELIEYLQNQIEQLNTQLQEERQQNDEYQAQLNQSNTKNINELTKKFQSKDYDQEFENFKQQFVSEISEKVEELQNQLEKERENVNKLLHSSKFDGNEIVNQLRTENKVLKQQLQDAQQKNCQKEGSKSQNEFDSVKINELETLISQMEEERKQACEMVKLMKEAHDKLKSKYEDEIKQLKEKHSLEFCKYEENIRYTIEKKDQSIQKLYLVIENLKASLQAINNDEKK
ncbi:hypothetical protein ABPG74_017884 [Tetrahymena malaccensis]